MSIKTNSIIGLFVGLALILAINPRLIYNIYDTILGRLVLITIVVFFSMNNVTLGLLVALVLIVVINNYTTFAEGMENISTPDTVGAIPSSDTTPYTVGEENIPQTGGIKVFTKDATKNALQKRISDLKAQAAMGVDKNDIRSATMAKPSNSIPVNKSTFQSDEVSANVPNSTLTEGFWMSAGSVY